MDNISILILILYGFLGGLISLVLVIVLYILSGLLTNICRKNQIIQGHDINIIQV